MTTLSLLFFSIVLTGSVLVAAAVIKGATTKSPFKPRKTDHDKARNLAERTLERIHP